MNTIRVVGINIAKPVFQAYTSGLMMILLHRIETPHAPNCRISFNDSSPEHYLLWRHVQLLVPGNERSGLWNIS